MKRSPLRRGVKLATSPLKRGAQPLRKAVKPLTSRTATRRLYEAQFRAMRVEVMERAGGQCEWRQDDPWSHRGCVRDARQIHHRVLRSQGGTNEPENLMAVCSKHHRLIHDNPDEAYKRGWLVHPWCDPGDIPINRGAA